MCLYGVLSIFNGNNLLLGRKARWHWYFPKTLFITDSWLAKTEKTIILVFKKYIN